MSFNRDTVKAAADIVKIIGQYVRLRQQGKEWLGLCPFHKEKTPSFTVTPANQTWYCHGGCKTGGDVFTFMGLYEHLVGFQAQLARVAELVGVEPEPNGYHPHLNGAAIAPARKPELVATYDYKDESGTVLYQVLRFEPGKDGKPKYFEQYRPDGKGGLIAGLGESRHVLYQLPEVINADTVWLVEGEKDADTITLIGLVGTTKSGGKMPADAPKILRGKKLFIIPDNDTAGEKQANEAHALLGGTIVRLPAEFNDVTDFVAAGAGRSDLEALIPVVGAATPRASSDLSAVGSPLRESVEAAIASRNPVKAMELASMIAHISPTQQAIIITALGQGFGRELNRQLLTRAIKDEAIRAKAESMEMRGDWRRMLIVTGENNPKPTPNQANAMTVFRHAPEWAGVLGFNEFSARMEVLSTTPWGKPAGEVWTENDDRLTVEWLQRAGIDIRTNSYATDALLTIAMEHTFHPVRDYLNGLTWDGVPRLNDLAVKYFGGEDKDISRKFARLWMISAVARIMKPGCKVDTCIVLESDQGNLKSTAFYTLANPWFTDQLSPMGTKDSHQECNGSWIIELQELEGLKKVETSDVKAFVSLRNDRIRLPYAKNVTEWPRGCVFGGSVNHTQYLMDETGARRFWPIKCIRKCDTDALAADRDQLWAEAVDQYNADAQWWLDEASMAAAESEQSERYSGGVWDELIKKWLADPTERLDDKGHPVGTFSSNTDSVTSADILTHCIGKITGQWNRSDQMTVSAALRSLGWECYVHRSGTVVERRYRRKVKS
jgi:hypothetical protein